ncbi:hypothetical protein B0H34DRAFT_807427 [Crassisporium funariophilum]|nr:hypothetical protein B0H34DRAFT_807427 [Crassisporium funariophilum]
MPPKCKPLTRMSTADQAPINTAKRTWANTIHQEGPEDLAPMPKPGAKKAKKKCTAGQKGSVKSAQSKLETVEKCTTISNHANFQAQYSVAAQVTSIQEAAPTGQEAFTIDATQVHHNHVAEKDQTFPQDPSNEDEEFFKISDEAMEDAAKTMRNVFNIKVVDKMPQTVKKSAASKLREVARLKSLEDSAADAVDHLLKVHTNLEKWYSDWATSPIDFDLGVFNNFKAVGKVGGEVGDESPRQNIGQMSSELTMAIDAGCNCHLKSVVKLV